MLSLKRMWELRGQVVVNAPPDQVFSYVTDFHRHHEWLPEEVETQKTSDGPLSIGSTFKRIGYGAHTQYGSSKYQADLVVAEYAPNQRLAFERRGAGGSVGYFIDVEPAPLSGGTLVSVRQEVLRGWGWLLGLPLLPLLPLDRWHKRRKVRRIRSRLDEY